MSAQCNDNERGVRLDADTIKRLRELETFHGSFAAARMIGISTEGFARGLARLPLYPGTVAKIRRYFQVTR